MTTIPEGIRALSLEQLTVSNTGSQAERRKHFDKAAIAELAESIKTVGLLSPIVARPVMSWALPCGHAIVQEGFSWSTSSHQTLQSAPTPQASSTAKDVSGSQTTDFTPPSRKAKRTAASSSVIGSEIHGESEGSTASKSDSTKSPGLAGTGPLAPLGKLNTYSVPHCPICGSDGKTPKRRLSTSAHSPSTSADSNGHLARTNTSENTGTPTTEQSPRDFDAPRLLSVTDAESSGSILIDASGQVLNGSAPKYSIVAGERRFMAAKLAGLTAIDVSVRTLTDEQVLEVQLIENLQREGLHELAEAEGYEALQKLGHSAEEIADKVGKSKGYVYARLKLTALSKPARKAFYEGNLTASTALLLARIPIESLQIEALKAITQERYLGAAMSFREAADLIRREYMTNLSDAGFPTEAADLVATAGPCGACPKRTGNQAELFDDVKSGNVCTDPVCFKAKREAYAALEIARAQEAGQTVLTGKEAKKVKPHSYGGLSGGYVALTDKCYDDSKARTYGQLLGKSFQPVLVQDPETGALIKAAPPAAVKDALKAAGVKDRSAAANPQSAAEKKAKAEKKFRVALYSAMREKFPEELGTEDLRTIALRFFEALGSDSQKQMLGLWQWEPYKGKYGQMDYEKAAAAGLADLSDANVVKFLFDLVFIRDLIVHTYSSTPAPLLLNTAKKLKVNVEQVRKQLNADSIPKAPKKRTRKKK